MKQFVYLIKDTDDNSSIAELEQELDILGGDGWELAGVLYRSTSDDWNMRCVFKREKREVSDGD